MRVLIIASLSCSVCLYTSIAPAAATERSVEIRYVAHVEGVPEGAEALELWIPVPQDRVHQKITEFNVKSPFPFQITTDDRYGNKTLYLKVEGPPATFDVEMAFRAERYADTEAFGRERDKYLVERALEGQTLVPLAPEIRKLAESVVAGQETPEAKARALYDHSLAHMTYDKSGTGWGRGDYRHACDVGRGNCTDFHSYFIALSRNVGVPAYFEIGVSLPPERGEGKTGGYHC
ncbi:MAG: transglutaminase domain-containing protein, partial [bacterium]